MNLADNFFILNNHIVCKDAKLTLQEILTSKEMNEVFNSLLEFHISENLQNLSLKKILNFSSDKNNISVSSPYSNEKFIEKKIEVNTTDFNYSIISKIRNSFSHDSKDEAYYSSLDFDILVKNALNYNNEKALKIGIKNTLYKNFYDEEISFQYYDYQNKKNNFEKTIEIRKDYIGNVNFISLDFCKINSQSEVEGLDYALSRNPQLKDFPQEMVKKIFLYNGLDKESIDILNLTYDIYNIDNYKVDCNKNIIDLLKEQSGKAHKKNEQFKLR